MLDPTEGQANPFPAPNGLSVAEVEGLVRAIGRAVPLVAAAITAYAPDHDVDSRICQAAFRIIEAILAASRRT